MMDEASPPAGEEQQQQQSEGKEPELCLEILPLIKEAQNQHGLRHGDYQRYRMYCSRRLRRIRKSLHFTQGHRHRYQQKAVTPELVTDIRYLCIPLVSAERAWATAMELKQAANTEHRKKFHLLQRLGKAAKHAGDLLRLCDHSNRCDARTRLEIQAYCSWIAGNVKFEQQRWQEALDCFGQSQTIYEKLSGAVSEEQRVLYRQRVDEISPNIRYCAYNIGDMPTDIAELMKLRSDPTGSDMLSSKIDLVLAKTQEKAASSLTEVTWLGKKLPVKSERLRVSLVKLQQVEGELGRGGGEGGGGGEEGRMEVYERLLMECQDTMQIVRDEISAEMAIPEKKRSQKNEAQRANLRLIMDYLTHVKHSHAISRNLLLIETMKGSSAATSAGRSAAGSVSGRTTKPEEFVRVYDILIQHVSELSDIPGMAEDLSVEKENVSRTFAFKAFRCYHLAESYIGMQRWGEGVGLLDRALEHVTQATQHCQDLPQEPTLMGKSLVQELRQLQETIRGRKCEIHINSILDSQDVGEKMSTLSISSKPLSEQMDRYQLVSPSKLTLAPLPPDYQPLSCKPLFFDLALNHVEYPSLSHRAEKKTGGLTGFMKGLIWGGNS